jgi:hypothetical protein
LIESNDLVRAVLTLTLKPAHIEVFPRPHKRIEIIYFAKYCVVFIQ